MSGIFIRRIGSSKSVVAMLGVLALSAGCGSPEHGPARQTEQYQVIDEGAVSGVTSTIHAPGDLVPVRAPAPATATGTNLDTTTAFSILDPLITTAPPAEFDPAVPAAPQAIPPATAPRAAPSNPRPPATPPPAPRPAPIPTPSETPDPEPTPFEEEEPPAPAEEPDEPAEPTPTPPGIDPANDEPPMELQG